MDIKIFCCIFYLLLVKLLVNGTPVPTRQGGKHVLCYYRAISAMLPQPEYRFVPEDIDLTICTHVVYSRAIVGSDLKVAPRNFQQNDVLGSTLYRIVALKERKPGLKVILSLRDSDAVLRDVAVSNNHEGLSAFARNVAYFVQSNGFDGVDFNVHNHEGFKKIVRVLHEELAGKEILLMTFYLPFERDHKNLRPELQSIHIQYEMTESISRNFDLIVLGSYYHLPGDYTDIFSPLTELEDQVEEFKSKGIPTEKLVVPIPAISPSMIICNAEGIGPNYTTCGFGAEGLYASSSMMLHNSQVLRKIANSTEGWVVRRDPESKVSYGYNKALLWVSFEDPVSVRAKAAVILERNLAGAAIMDIDREDFKGVYTENGETFPLTRAAYNALNGESEAEHIPNAVAVKYVQ